MGAKVFGADAKAGPAFPGAVPGLTQSHARPGRHPLSHARRLAVCRGLPRYAGAYSSRPGPLRTDLARNGEGPIGFDSTFAGGLHRPGISASRLGAGKAHLAARRRHGPALTETL